MFYYFFVLLLLQWFGEGDGGYSSPWKLSKDWPKYRIFGQISAVSVDSVGNIYVFHRGDRIWDSYSFTPDNRFSRIRDGPIREPTIIVLDDAVGLLKKRSGHNMFFMPHGLTVDHLNNLWITDVALHQVFKFSPSSLNISLNNDAPLSSPEITLGVKFEPGSDNMHFCKPTDVAVDKDNGDFFVSDGYCNSRIIKYNKSGKRLLEWGRNGNGHSNPYFLNLPHALAIDSDDNQIFVADRENDRTVVYSTSSGNFIKSYTERQRIYSIAYSSQGGKHLFTLSNSTNELPGIVTVYDVQTGSVTGNFSPPNYFSNPHSIAISPNGHYCYVAQLNPHILWKFELRNDELVKHKKMPDTNVDVINHSQNNKPHNAIHEEALISNNDFLGGTVLAIGVVSFVIVISFLIFVFHIYKKKARYSQYEMRRLILDEEEEVCINVP